MKLGIFTSFNGNHIKFVDSCKEIGIDYEIIDILSADWVNLVKKSDCNGFLCSSTCDSQERKTILDERYYFVNKVLDRPIYPDFLGLYIHESKRNMAAWLDAYGYPYTPTKVFTSKEEALQYISQCKFPIVAKANLGSAASKVLIIKSYIAAKRYIKKIFPTKKLPILNRGKIYWRKIRNLPIPDLASPQKDYVLFQEYKDIAHEWRIIKIGNSYFGHQKLLKGQFASGSGLVGWVDPPRELLKMVHNICEDGGFYCMDVDIFETKNGEYFINELQASFGSYLDYQMSIEGKHGRYKYIDGDFIFEEGDFNVHGSAKLKVEHFIEILNGQTD